MSGTDKISFCIAGPTASGKSAAAVRLAKAVGGEIINADSMQVYTDLHIISARPDTAEMDGVPHHLFGHIDGSVRHNVGAWLEEAVEIAEDIRSRGRHPIFIGGTGLYFKALTVGLAQIPEPGKAVRDEAEQILADRGIDELRRRAEYLDPVATARVLGDDPQRLGRIVSVAMGTGNPLSAWQTQTYPALAAHTWRAGVLMPERQMLYGRINQRFDEMAQSGGLEEARALSARDLDSGLPVMKAIGVPELITASAAKTDQDKTAAIDLAKQQTRRFAKRQMTWFRNQTPDWPKFETGDHLLRHWSNFAQDSI